MNRLETLLDINEHDEPVVPPPKDFQPRPMEALFQRIGISKILMPHETGIKDSDICCFFPASVGEKSLFAS